MKTAENHNLASSISPQQSKPSSFVIYSKNDYFRQFRGNISVNNSATRATWTAESKQEKSHHLTVI